MQQQQQLLRDLIPPLKALIDSMPRVIEQGLPANAPAGQQELAEGALLGPLNGCEPHTLLVKLARLFGPVFVDILEALAQGTPTQIIAGCELFRFKCRIEPGPNAGILEAYAERVSDAFDETAAEILAVMPQDGHRDPREELAIETVAADLDECSPSALLNKLLYVYGMEYPDVLETVDRGLPVDIAVQCPEFTFKCILESPSDAAPPSKRSKTVSEAAECDTLQQ